MAQPDTQNGRKLVFSPTPGSYAVIRLAPVAMVRPFDDSEALLEAQAMQPKSYLVFLTWDLALPFPDQPWYKYEIEPIAPSSRSEDKARGISSDMCIPIFPNTSHPTGRKPIKPEPEGLFPYDNCYHWFDAKASVRVRARPEEFDETNAVALSVRTEIQMMRCWEEDGPRMFDNRDKLQLESEVVDHSPDGTKSPSQPLPEAHASPENHPLSEDVVSLEPHTASESQTASRESITGPEDTDGSPNSGSDAPHPGTSTHSLEDIAAMEIFSGPNDDSELVPLVDLWMSDLAEHLKQEDIPSPLEMYAEFDHIAKIVQRARIRSYAALTMPANASGEDTDSASDVIIVEKRKLGPGRPRYWGKLRAQVQRFSSRFRGMLRLPYIPIWP
ncbi:hypothetical protein GY45DRAFT_1372780 [Cubamyces sp. BRFM 1775]|nr:hypothetical protein GY45DRAFT_1372780 [Cubamyces sp. BRFM 1775]